MKVQIENNYYLESDGTQFLIKEYTGKFTPHPKGGEPIPQYKKHGSFPNVEGALKQFLKLKIMDSTAKTLVELREDIKRVREGIETNFSMELLIQQSEKQSALSSPTPEIKSLGTKTVRRG